MTESEFKTELKDLRGGYLFFGGEDYLKYSYSKEVEKRVLDGSFDEFNHIIIYGEEYSPAVLSNAIATLPLMAEKKLVEMRGVDFNSMKKDDIASLEAVLSSLKENDHTILLIRADNEYFSAGKLPKSPSEIYKMMSKHLTPVEFEFPGVQRLRTWILRHFANGGVDFPAELCERLVAICGHDMWTLSREIEKLCAYAKMNKIDTLTGQALEDVCCKTVEFEDFQLTNCLLERNKSMIFETLRRQKSSHEPPQAILSSVVRLYSDMLIISRLLLEGLNKTQIASAINMHEFRVGKYISSLKGIDPKRIERAQELCREADIKSKSAANVTSYIAVERLISELCALLCR